MVQLEQSYPPNYALPHPSKKKMEKIKIKIKNPSAESLLLIVVSPM